MDGRCIIYVCVDVKCRSERGICAGGVLLFVVSSGLELSTSPDQLGDEAHDIMAGRESSDMPRPGNSELDRRCHRQTEPDNLLKTKKRKQFQIPKSRSCQVTFVSWL